MRVVYTQDKWGINRISDLFFDTEHIVYIDLRQPIISTGDLKKCYFVQDIMLTHFSCPL